MPQVYTVTTRNTFAVLDDSDTEDVIMSKPENLDQVVAVKKPETPELKRPTDKRPLNNRERKPRVEAAEAVDDNKPSVRPPRPVPRRPRVGTKESTAPSVREEKRVFDRVSGTGRGRENKKSGGGAHNWGNENADFGAEATTTEAGAEVVVTEARDGPVETSPTGDAAPTVDVPKTMTYEQFQAQLEKPTLNVTPVLQPEESLPAGYQEYHKDVVAPSKKEGSGEGFGKKPKAIHLAEFAAQSGVQLNYTGGRPNRGKPPVAGERPSTERSSPDRRGDKPPAATASKDKATRDLDLSDSQAFPTLEAH